MKTRLLKTRRWMGALVVAAGFIHTTVNGQFVTHLQDPVDYVNPLMGTDSKFELSNGNTYPSIGLPWGMNMWTPQTGEMGSGWQYTYGADKIRGFKQTHQPSPWMNDYGQFSIMPTTGGIKVDQNKRASWFSHKAEIVKPYYYKVFLADANVTTELTPTERSAQFQITYPNEDSAALVIDAFDRGSYIKVLPEQQKIVGYTSRYSRGKLKNFKNYFVIYLDKPFSYSQIYDDTTLTDKKELQANHVLAVIGFSTKQGEKVHARVASSFISEAQAELNLKREQGTKSFDQLAAEGRKIWNEKLGRIKAEGGSVDQTRTFYSCLYRMMFFPCKLYEIDAQGKPVHWSPYNGEVKPGYMFAGTGFWDTFRALYPFLSLVFPDINKEMQQGLINDYKEGGWLPEWSSPGYSNIMLGQNSASVVAGAYLKGIRGYDINTLYEAIVHGAHSKGPEASGRSGFEDYDQYGYIPSDSKTGNSVARTLEYAYDDYAIYALGKALGKPKSETDLYRKRALNYKNVFDPSTNFMRGKNADGSFVADFDPYSWSRDFIEGNSWHYTWSVFQDIQGLMDLMGGKKYFIQKLDSVFSAPPLFAAPGHKARGMIHEMREMQVMNMGQYAHGNQPIQHMIYLYSYAGAPWKAQYWVREAINRLYKATPDGYCGDEDNGQTSAWYVFSAMGFYPVCPASAEYILGAPLFKKMTVQLENGKSFSINAPQNSRDNRYIESMTVNGKPYTKNYISHQDLLNGAQIQVKMGSQPNEQRGIAPADRPFSLSLTK
ncbi:GH92 family glycosyl hydrolase [Arachidicoccus rhizosphaerae]|nr:GH92 family glycosyl hydrolase [Arachidicoccus rhizosphaerae]